MNAVLDLMRNCEKSDVKISVNGQMLKIDAPTNLADSLKDALRRHKADIIRTLTQRSDPTLHKRLNAIIAAGASFDVGISDFQVFGGNYLTDAEKDFLTVNKIFVLCTLQQGLLMKYLPENLIPDFIFEVRERVTILADGDGLTETPFEIVRDVTGEWFADLLDEMLDTAARL
jgi:hypothetical protein